MSTKASTKASTKSSTKAITKVSTKSSLILDLLKRCIIVTLCVVLCVVSCGSLTACTTPSESEEGGKETKATGSETESATAGETAPDGMHLVTDHAGNTVAVPNEINRVVVCDIYPLPSIISVFFNSAEKIVGMAKQSMAAAKSNLLSELYPEILNAETGFIDGTDVNIEELLKLSPDVVFYNAGNPALGEKIKSAGLYGIAISAGKWKYDAIATLDGWVETLDQVFYGGIEHTETDLEFLKKTTAERVKISSEAIYDLIQERVKTIPAEKREKVFFLFQYSDEALLTCGNPSFGKWWCDAIGADCVVTETTPQNSLKVNMEQVYEWNPSLIFITNFTTVTPQNLYKKETGNDDWTVVSAVENERVYKMPLGLYRTYTAGADTPLALLWLAKACYPELFEDVDLVNQAVIYYYDAFGVEITREQAKRIFGSGE